MNETPVSFWPLSLKDWASIVQVVFTVVVIIIGAFLGWLRFGWFRTTQPHASILQKVSHRQVGNNHIDLAIEVTVLNTSKVVLRFREGFISVQQIAPSTDEKIEELAQQLLDEPNLTDMQWDTLERKPLFWDKDAFLVEPGESDIRTYEIVVPWEVQAVLIHTFFYNEKVTRRRPNTMPDLEKPHFGRIERKNWMGDNKSGPEGWRGTTVYDLFEKVLPREENS